MKESFIKKIKLLNNRFKEIEILLKKNNINKNYKKFYLLSKEYYKIIKIKNYLNNIKEINNSIKNTKKFINDIEMKDIAKKEILSLKNNKDLILKKINLLINKKNKLNNYLGCFIEIRSGSGGKESSIFANDLLKMYAKYSEYNKWNFNIITANYSEYGGYKSVIAKVSTKESYKKLKFESGGHRVQRIPITETQGRIHSSACTVIVMPEIEKKKLLDINIKDLRIDTFKSSGAGGQHVNTTDSAVRITHIPSGITSECQNERSQHSNKAKALEILGARLRNKELKKRKEEESFIRNNLKVSGDRSDRIRTYNFPQKRVTDHRISLTKYCIDKIMNGYLDILIDPLIHLLK
ncbi:peptide chain release factor 1 [Sodalis-like secondary symbiont of Drepanosiphum platanoidis]|uniref:peptide chain release factor 1 n=1 Tax=Sodalis-like secondary symbiont of Drepanosiphum platanoidis TaxID=2994493 RepID=UPI003464305F